MENLEAIRAQLKNGNMLMCELAKSRGYEVDPRIVAKRNTRPPMRGQLMADIEERSGERKSAE